MRKGRFFMLQFRVVHAARVTLCVALATLWCMPCVAQSASSTAPAGSASSASDKRTAILQELDAMRKRIDELEAELKKTDTEEQQSKAREATDVKLTVQATLDPVTVPADANEQSLSVTPAGQESAPAAAKAEKKPASEPFAFADFSWLNGNSREKDTPLDTKLFTPEFRADVSYIYDFNHPKDDTLVGSSESGRTQEIQIQQLGIGGDFHYDNVRGRLMTQFGMYSTMTPRNDASPARGQWDLSNAYRYLSEAYGGYHFDVMHGINVDAGIFMSYIGLFSYYNYDNWAYQPSYVSSNTPWFFNGLRVQIFPTDKLKIEPWFINGWQSYGRFNKFPGLGGQIAWRPTGWLSFIFNNYGMGTDTLGVPGRSRLHTDDSVEVKYYDRPEKTLDKAAFSLTGDAGCEYGGGVTCHGGSGGPKQAFLGFMAYNRFWFHKDLYALTLGGGKMNNPGRYLTLLPPINGADAVSGSPYFTGSPGDKAHMWDATVNLQYMPRQYITWWFETGYRHSDVPYWTGRGGITPPGGNTGSPGQYVCAAGGSAGTSNLSQAYSNCGGPGSVWFPDLRKGQATISAGVLVKF